MIVAEQAQHTPERRAARKVAVAQYVARAIHARAFAVPHREDAVVRALARERDLLRTPARGRGEIFVHAGVELDVVLFEQLAGAHELLIECTEGRSAVAGNVAGGVMPGGGVTLALHHRQTHQRLNTREEHTPRFERVLLVERDGVGRYGFGGFGVTGHEEPTL